MSDSFGAEMWQFSGKQLSMSACGFGCTRVFIGAYVCICACACLCTHVPACLCRFMGVCVWICVCIRVCGHAHRRQGNVSLWMKAGRGPDPHPMEFSCKFLLLCRYGGSLHKVKPNGSQGAPTKWAKVQCSLDLGVLEKPGPCLPWSCASLMPRLPCHTVQCSCLRAP